MVPIQALFLHYHSRYNPSTRLLVYSSTTMAHYPEISAIDFVLRANDGRIIQAPVHVPKYVYQHTGNFDRYKPTPHDFEPYEGPGPAQVLMRKGIAFGLWETMHMKVKYILSAAHRWNRQIDTTPLPSVLPEHKLTEIGMPPPPFPDPQLLTVNIFLTAETHETLCNWVDLWQVISLNLSAWIAKAKQNCVSTPGCTWAWPHSPFDIYPAGDPSDSDDDDGTTTTSTLYDSSSLFTSGDHGSQHDGSPSPSPVLATSLSVATGPRVPKRARSSSPDSTSGSEPNNKQLVLWKPSPLQLLVRETALREGQVRSVEDQPALPPTPVNTPAVQAMAPASVEQAPATASNDDIPTLMLNDPATVPAPVVNDPIPTTDVQAPGPSNFAHLSNVNRLISPLPLHSSRASNQQPLVFEYETKSEMQESRGRVGFM